MVLGCGVRMGFLCYIRAYYKYNLTWINEMAKYGSTQISYERIWDCYLFMIRSLTNNADVYNCLTIHGLASSSQLPSSVLEIRQFWKNTAYSINGHTFSLDDIEHGILRSE